MRVLKAIRRRTGRPCVLERPVRCRSGPSHRRDGTEDGPTHTTTQPPKPCSYMRKGAASRHRSPEKREGGLGKTAFSLPMFSPRLALRRLAPAELLRACEAGRRVVWTRNRLVPPSADG